MAAQVWIDPPSNPSCELVKKIQEQLSQAGIEIVDRGKGVGLILFSQEDDELSLRLIQKSQGGERRVIAVCLDREGIPPRLVWSLLRAGASDCYSWFQGNDPVASILARLERWLAVDRVLHSTLVRENLVGNGRIWQRLLRQIIEIASFSEAPVLITGESGTGKELIARLIHTLSPRKSRPDLVVLDCSTIVPELSGSEFFGHERGAFTGAATPRDGAFAMADGGTLFLDEVGELPMRLQAELLRVVQEGTFKRVGGNTWHKTRFRLVCATNRDLLTEQSAGRFRSDLFYRIASSTCHLPPLRERSEDVLPLVDHFWRQFQPDFDLDGDSGVRLDPAVRDYLLTRDYPGNVRELRQLVARIALRHVGPAPITVGDIPEDERPQEDSPSADWRLEGFEQAITLAITQGVGMKEIGRQAEEVAERIVLHQEGGNLQRAAQRLGVSDRALQIRRAARNQDPSSQGLTQIHLERGQK
jgi:transcriptional regulator with GAF, ATPase, and Fis domain